MEEKTLISSYDEVNDTFVGKVNGESGFCADYCISDGVYLGIDENNIPNSVYVDDASRVFNISKKVLENSNVKIDIVCDSLCLIFKIFIEGLNICSIKCENVYGIPSIIYSIDSNH
ncbi:hypothetical protein [Methanobrevibacter sp.]|uniref:hypothetical protein n=1 Tax=Methanobrevibacter sp. TaxID=66852 RepID=UPI00388DD178